MKERGRERKASSSHFVVYPHTYKYSLSVFIPLKTHIQWLLTISLLHSTAASIVVLSLREKRKTLSFLYTDTLFFYSTLPPRSIHPSVPFHSVPFRSPILPTSTSTPFGTVYTPLERRFSIINREEFLIDSRTWSLRFFSRLLTPLGAYLEGFTL